MHTPLCGCGGQCTTRDCRHLVESAGSHGEDGGLALFTDGSAGGHEWPGSKRAGWGVVVLKGEEKVFQAQGPVPGHLPQTAPSAEWCAAEVAATIWSSHLPNPRGDCKQVVDACGGDPRQQLMRGGSHGGRLRSILQVFGGTMRMDKVKAHRDIAAAEGPEDRIDVFGNNAADEAAKFGAGMHPRPSQHEIREAARSWTLLQDLCKVAAEITAVWPPIRSFLQGQRAGRGGARPGGGKAGRTAAGRKGSHPDAPIEDEHRHCFASFGGRLLCECCLVPARTWAGAHRRTARERCGGRSEVMWSALTSSDLGHTLAMGVFEGRAVCICLRCGCFSSAKVLGLGKPCPGKPGPHQRYALSLFKRGRHPDQRKREVAGDAFFRVGAGMQLLPLVVVGAGSGSSPALTEW